MISFQREIVLEAKPRGFHLITSKVLESIPEISGVKIGRLHIFIKHTSASLTLNENADPTVRQDFESAMNKIVPENQPYYKHTFEGKDDMPAHIKASLLGTSIDVPVSNGQANLGTWQGIYLCEHRNRGGARKLVLTLLGT